MKKYVLLLNSEGVSVNKAYLFGSYMNNTARDSSDIVSDNCDENDDFVIGKIWNLTKK